MAGLSQGLEPAIELVKRWEGLSLSPYVCPAGHLTIGYGHLITASEKRDGLYLQPISHQQADALFHKDFTKHLMWTMQATPAQVNFHQLGALTSFVFNLGIGNYKASTLRKRVIAGDHANVPYQLSRWVYSSGVKLKGLVNRRREEALLYKY